MNNINELASSSSDAVVLSTSASGKFFQICIELMSKSKLFWLIFLPLALSPSAMVVQSTQPSTVLVLVPSTSETVVSSTSTTFRKFKSYFFVHFVCNMCICIYICFGWLEFNNKLALPNGKPQNLLYLFASHKTCCIYLQSCNMVLGGRGGAVCTPFYEGNLYTTVTWYWAEGGRPTPPSMKSIYTPLVTIFTSIEIYFLFFILKLIVLVKIEIFKRMKF
ncbi:uncharacterized protein LOC124812102 isoform X3 [Hydra vulgaris]|uniref:uncharacterized protein LOC124812102 isoform X3 n=1 Tax=Hydra vulgaris TaxID=6087 RepID=UPI0032EA84D5